jgi:hypothetical protein
MTVFESQSLYIFGSMTARSRQDMNAIGQQLTDETLLPTRGWALEWEVTVPRFGTILGPSPVRSSYSGPHIRRKGG